MRVSSSILRKQFMEVSKVVGVFYIKTLLAIHNGTLFAKIQGALIIALTISPIAYYVEKFTTWTILNQDFINAVLFAIAIDHIIGSIYHGFKVKDFTVKKNLKGILQKTGYCALAGMIFEMMSGIAAKHQTIFDYLQLVTRLSVFLYPAGSALMNISALTNGVFPPIGWIKKIKTFNNDLDLDKFTGGTKQETYYGPTEHHKELDDNSGSQKIPDDLNSSDSSD